MNTYTHVLVGPRVLFCGGLFGSLMFGLSAVRGSLNAHGGRWRLQSNCVRTQFSRWAMR